MHVRQLNNTETTARESHLQREIVQLKRDLNRSKACMAALWLNLDTVLEIKQALPEDEVYAQQLWDELEYRDQDALMLAPKFGGCFTTLERMTISKFWRQVGT